MEIRPARPDEASRLSALAFSSKASWGYDEPFMEQCRDELTLTPSYIATHAVFLAEEGAAILGFHALGHPTSEREVLLDSLFIDPTAQGQGVGRALFQHAVTEARRIGADTLVIESDPFAEGFYRAMGAEPAGTVASGSVSGRTLPRLIVWLGLVEAGAQ